MFQFSGNVGNDPQIKQVGERKVMEFSVALYAGKKDGQAQTQWIKAAQWFDGSYEIKDWQQPMKGDFVIVSGTINPATVYTSNAGKQGVDLSCFVDRVEISRKGQSGAAYQQSTPAQQPQGATLPQKEVPAMQIPQGDDSDLPF